jgi:Spy/CpxP family protein refolding chaperone
MKVFTNFKCRRMKKIIMNAAILLAVVFTTNVFAQTPPAAQPQGPGPDRGEKIEALRIAFITQELNLTPQEAQKFWPVYNQYRGDMKTLHDNFKPAQGGAQLTAEQQLDFEQKKLDLKKRYKAQFEGAVGKDKVNQLYNIEQKFHEKLKELRDQRQQQRGGGQGPPAGGQRGGGRQGGRF